MVYDGRSQCSCPEGYLKAGDGCIKQSEFDQLFSSGYIVQNGDELRVQYNNVRTIGKDGVGSVLTDSDVFSYFYYQSAVGCKFEKNHKDCQVLANLCVLQLYNEYAQACQLIKDL